MTPLVRQSCALFRKVTQLFSNRGPVCVPRGKDTPNRMVANAKVREVRWWAPTISALVLNCILTSMACSYAWGTDSAVEYQSPSGEAESTPPKTESQELNANAQAHNALVQSLKVASMPGHNGWLMTASALILFMTSPGLALFYAGLVRKKNVLSVFMQCIFLTAVMTVVWSFYGYSLAFSHGGSWNHWIGGGQYLFLHGVSRSWDEAKGMAVTPMLIVNGVESPITLSAHMIFQGMYFSIAPAIMCGAFAERMKFHGMILFSILWGTCVYCPIAHCVWGGGMLSYPSGFMGGALDFAGGIVVHVSSGVSALVAAVVIGPRLGFGKDPMPPHNLTYTAIGAAMLWFGWFGFNAGSAIGSIEVATSAFVTTHLAAAGGAIGWWLVEWKILGRSTVLGVSSGLVAGLVAITSSAGLVHPMPALFTGFSAGIVCYFACSLCKHWAGYDDALDAFGIHGVGGIVGAIFAGIFSTRACANLAGGQKLGLLEGGNIIQGHLWAIFLVMLYSGLISWLLLKTIDWTIGLRVSASDERQGLDVQEHGEEGYIFL